VHRAASWWRTGSSYHNERSGTYTHHLVTGLEIEMTSLLDADGVTPKRDDLRLAVLFGIDF
jgi:hypothetical protein